MEKRLPFFVFSIYCIFNGDSFYSFYVLQKSWQQAAFGHFWLFSQNIVQNLD